MPYPGQLPDLRYLVFQQYTYYTAEMTKTHKALSKQYGKLADVERNLEERHELHLTRKSKKKLQWSRALTKKAIDSLESQQAWLHAYLCQCHELLALYRSNDYDRASPLYSENATPTPYPFSTETFSATTPSTHRYPGDGTQIRCWDPRDRILSSPYGSSAGSGFYEPSIHSPPFDSGHSTFPCAYNSSAAWIINGANNPRTSFSTLSSSSERDNVPELFTATSLVKSGIEPTSARKRRYSENAIQLIESRHLEMKTHHRGRSVDHISVFHRTGSENHVVGQYNMAEKRQSSLCDADTRT